MYLYVLLNQTTLPTNLKALFKKMPIFIKIIICGIGLLFSINIFLCENVLILSHLSLLNLISIGSISDKIKSNQKQFKSVFIIYGNLNFFKASLIA